MHADVRVSVVFHPSRLYTVNFDLLSNDKLLLVINAVRYCEVPLGQPFSLKLNLPAEIVNNLCVGG